MDLNETINLTINETINQTTNATGKIILTADYVIPAVLIKLKDIILAPIMHPKMFWISIPLILTFILKEYYFAKHAEEKFSWGTAFANSIVLLFVSLDLIRYIYTGYEFQSFKILFEETFVKAIIAISIGIFGILLTIGNFKHSIPESIAFIFSSPLIINVWAYFAIISVYTNVLEPYSFANYIITFSSFMLLFIIIVIIDFTSKDKAKNAYR
jgi:hypothetical protein